MAFYVLSQPPGFETGELAVGRQEQHQNRRFRNGFSAAGRQHVGNQLWITALRLSRSHSGKSTKTPRRVSFVSSADQRIDEIQDDSLQHRTLRLVSVALLTRLLKQCQSPQSTQRGRGHRHRSPSIGRRIGSAARFTNSIRRWSA